MPSWRESLGILGSTALPAAATKTSPRGVPGPAHRRGHRNVSPGSAASSPGRARCCRRGRDLQIHTDASLTSPAARGTCVCSRPPATRTPSPATPPPRRGSRAPWSLRRRRGPGQEAARGPGRSRAPRSPQLGRGQQLREGPLHAAPKVGDRLVPRPPGQVRPSLTAPELSRLQPSGTKGSWWVRPCWGLGFWCQVVLGFGGQSPEASPNRRYERGSQPSCVQGPRAGSSQGPQGGGTAVPHRPQETPWLREGQPRAQRPSARERVHAADGRPRGRAVPGLKSTMARRQPSSVLSMCMSLILDTSSVSTLHRRRERAEAHVKPRPSRGPPQPSPWDSRSPVWPRTARAKGKATLGSRPDSARRLPHAGLSPPPGEALPVGLYSGSLQPTERPRDSQAEVSQGPGRQGPVHRHRTLRCRPTG